MKFKAKLFRYPGPGGWTFARVPEKPAPAVSAPPSANGWAANARLRRRLREQVPPRALRGLGTTTRFIRVESQVDFELTPEPQGYLRADWKCEVGLRGLVIASRLLRRVVVECHSRVCGVPRWATHGFRVELIQSVEEIRVRFGPEGVKHTAPRRSTVRGRLVPCALSSRSK
jgi:hypothetical protein